MTYLETQPLFLKLWENISSAISTLRGDHRGDFQQAGTLCSNYSIYLCIKIHLSVLISCQVPVRTCVVLGGIPGCSDVTLAFRCVTSTSPGGRFGEGP